MWRTIVGFLAQLAPTPPAPPDYLALPAPDLPRYEGPTVEELGGDDDDDDSDLGPTTVDAGEAASARLALTRLAGLGACRRALRRYVQEPAAALSARRRPEELWYALQRPQVLALHGLAGSGKATLVRLACHAAAPYAALQWLADARALEATVGALEAARARFARQPAAAQRAARETPPRTQAVYVLDGALVAASFAHRALLARLLAVLRDAAHTPGSAWRGLRPRIVVLVDAAQPADLAPELRDAVERWVYARPPVHAERAAILTEHAARVAGALAGPPSTVPPATIDALAAAYAWWTPAELADEVAQCAEQLLADGGPSDAGALAARLAAWPNHDGRLKVRQEKAKERWVALETRYGHAGSALDPAPEPRAAPRAPKRPRHAPASTPLPPAEEEAQEQEEESRPAKLARAASPPPPPPRPSEPTVPGSPVWLPPSPPPSPPRRRDEQEQKPADADEHEDEDEEEDPPPFWTAGSTTRARSPPIPARNQNTIQLTPNFGAF